MMSRIENEELIERYCQGLLTPEELRIFEQWRESDPEMAQSIDDHRLILDAFRVFAERTDLRNSLNTIHAEMESDAYRLQAPLKVVEKEENIIRILWRKYRMPAVAAAAAIIAVFASVLTFNLSGVGGNKSQTAYQELRREVESIKRNQKAIIKDINSVNTIPVETPESGKGFSGTGFALSSDGYILTSYHVVEDARQIYVSNEKFEQLMATPVYTNKALDLAVLKVDQSGFKSFGELPYSFKKLIADPGERVFTLGYPREELVYGEGSISSYTGYEGDTASYQISIPVNPGNSGGPLFDNQGNLLGIISGRNSSAEGASFAVKSKWITDYLNERSKEAKINISTRKNTKGMDRPTQIKKLKEFVFMVKVYN
ncbi:hypothetical protein BH11BAC2_BH11BAC2_12690 [soil metagenome]